MVWGPCHNGLAPWLPGPMGMLAARYRPSSMTYRAWLPARGSARRGACHLRRVEADRPWQCDWAALYGRWMCMCAHESAWRRWLVDRPLEKPCPRCAKEPVSGVVASVRRMAPLHLGGQAVVRGRKESRSFGRRYARSSLSPSKGATTAPALGRAIACLAVLWRLGLSTRDHLGDDRSSCQGEGGASTDQARRIHGLGVSRGHSRAGSDVIGDG